MKARHIILTTLLSLFVVSELWAQVFLIGDTAIINEEGQYLVHQTKLGSIAYGPKSWFTETRPVDIGIYLRKITRSDGKLIGKSIAFSGYTYNGTLVDSKSGYVTESEIDLAIKALQFINDSLLNSKPDHDVFYFSNFENSYLRIEASYNPYIDYGGKEWKVYLDFDRRLSREYINIKSSDVSALIKVLQVGKERLKDY